MTLEELGKKANVSRATIQRYKSGVISNIPSDRIELIAEALSVSPAYLMGWEDDNSQNGKYEVNTIAAHHDDYEFTEDELTEIEQFKEFIRMRKRLKEDENQK